MAEVSPVQLFDLLVAGYAQHNHGERSDGGGR
jgi:hypothetical protein